MLRTIIQKGARPPHARSRLGLRRGTSPATQLLGGASSRGRYGALSADAQHRWSSTQGSSGDGEVPVDDAIGKLFQKEADQADDAWFLDDASSAFEPTWYNLADHAVTGVNFLHDYTGMSYAGSILVATCLLRLAILPFAIRSQRAGSRMAHLQPELQQIKQRFEALGTPTQAEQKAAAEQMKAVFAKYEVKPFTALSGPLIQAPIFIGMFFGMKKMPELFPSELSTGGLYWFTDLTVPDPTYALPITCGLTFLATIEAGKDQMVDSNPQYGPAMVNAFRGMALIMVPVMTTFPAAMLCYWVPNNIFTLVQSSALRQAWVKKQLGIWDRPKPIPGSTRDVSFQQTMNNLVKQVQGEPTTEAEKIRRHNEEIDTKKQVAKLSKDTKARRRESTPKN